MRLLLSSGEGNSNPVQCSCLENPRDGRAWWAASYGVAQSRTRLKWLSSSSSPQLRSVFGTKVLHPLASGRAVSCIPLWELPLAKENFLHQVIILPWDSPRSVIGQYCYEDLASLSQGRTSLRGAASSELPEGSEGCRSCCLLSPCESSHQLSA